MADIKSAYEIAMEKINKIESATPEERLKWKFVPKGEELAGKYIKDDVNLGYELSKYKDEEKKICRAGNFFSACQKYRPAEKRCCQEKQP